jgi:uroporphyrinogen decarboxylase
MSLKQSEGYIRFRDEWGIGWKKPVSGGHYFDMEAHPLEGPLTLDDLKKYAWPDGQEENRTAGFRKDIEAAVSSEEHALMLFGVCAGVLEMALRLRGFEQLFMDLALDPGLACAILDKIVDIKMDYWKKALELAGKNVLVAVEGDDLGTQNSLMISPEMYRKYIKPRHTRLFSFIKKQAPHIKVFLHSCGAVRQLIPDFIESGVDILNPVQVSARDMDTKLLKKEFGEAITFWGGGVDTQRILPYGSVQEVKDEVRRRIDDLAPGGGFVFNTIHNIQADVPPQNIEAMLAALSEYGCC